MRQIEVLTNLSRGELGPTFYGRFDTEVYAGGVKTMKNFVAMREGGATSFPGTDYIGSIASQAVIHEFVISPSLTYLLIFVASHLYIWKSGTTALALDILTPYTLGDLKSLRFSQNVAMMVITTRNHPPKTLKYLGGDSFETTVGGALVDFTTDMVFTAGRQPFIGAGNYPALSTFFQGRVWFFSSLNEPGKFWASCPFEYNRFVYFETVSTEAKQPKDPASVAFIGSVTNGSATITGTQDLTSRLTTAHYVYGPGIPDGTAVLSTTVNTVTLSKAATKDAPDVGFNAMLWVTANPEYETVTNTRDVVTDASAIEAELASDQNDTILWVTAKKDLIIGTATSEWAIPAGVTAVNLEAELHTRNGSADIGSILVGDAILFPMGNGKGLREYLYSQEGGGYQSPEATFYAPHIMASGIAKIDWQNSPRTMVWVLLEDGKLAVAVYERAYQITAWARIELPGSVIETLAVLPAATGDEVFMVINRSGTRMMVRARQFFSTYQLDAAVKKTKAAGVVSGITHITGAAWAHHEGKYYAITIDGGIAALPSTIADGQVIDIGLRIESTISLLRPNVRSKNGTSQNSKIIINRIGVRLLESGLFKVGGSKGYEWSAEAYPFTGDTTVPFMGTWDKDGWADIITEEPMTILNVFREVDSGG